MIRAVFPLVSAMQDGRDAAVHLRLLLHLLRGPHRYPAYRCSNDTHTTARQIIIEHLRRKGDKSSSYYSIVILGIFNSAVDRFLFIVRPVQFQISTVQVI
jgi:hypothetical protein